MHKYHVNYIKSENKSKNLEKKKVVAYQNANIIDILLICTFCLYVSACFLKRLK